MSEDLRFEEVMGLASITVRVEGIDYVLVSPLLVDWALWRDRIRQEKREEAKRVAEDLKDLQLADELILQEYNSILNGFGVFDAHQIKTLKGAQFLFWRCCQKHHPEITEPRAQELITDENAREIITAIDELESAFMARMEARKKAGTEKNLEGAAEPSGEE